MENEVKIEVPEVTPTLLTIHIVGDSDLVLNKMDAYTERKLIAERNGEAKKLEPPNKWEQIVTSIHWLGGDPDIAPEEYTEETMKDKLTNDSPCLPAFGVKQQLGKGVVRFKLDKFKTGFLANVKLIPQRNGLIPITFSEHFIEERLMSPKRGAPVLTRTNHFVGWAADIKVSFVESIISIPSVINTFNLTGFGVGVGSGTSSDYGLFHVESVA